MIRAAVAHRQFSPEDLQLLLDWYKVRDTLLDIIIAAKKALELAAVCEHPHAVWLTKLFVERNVNTWDGARKVFLPVKTTQELLSLLRWWRICAMMFGKLLKPEMLMHKHVWPLQPLTMKSFFGPKDLLKESATVFTGPDNATVNEADAGSILRKRERTRCLLRSLSMLGGICLTQLIRNDFFG
jgi:hypothetical protein